MSIVQDYEEVISEYREMINTISRIEEESVNLAYELQKDLLRGSQIYAHDEDLKNVYKDIQLKEEIKTSISPVTFEPSNITINDLNLVKEKIKSITNLLHEVQEEMENFEKDKDDLK